MKAAQILKRKIQSDSLTLGVMATFHFWPGLVEHVMRAGLDYLIIDLEHLNFDAEMVAEACATGRRMDFPILIRPPAAEMIPLRWAMDLGPCGLLVPYIEDLAALHVVRDAVYLKPRGKRRPGGPGNLWVNNHHYPTWKAEVEDDLIILPQIESRTGLKNVEAIARDPLTTAMAIGPYDLSADLGVCWQPQSTELVGAIDRIRQTARAAGKNMWMIGDATTLVRNGFTFLCVAETTMFLEGALRDLTQRARDGRAQTAVPADKPLP